MEKVKQKDKVYFINPALEMVGQSMYEVYKAIKTKGHRTIKHDNGSEGKVRIKEEELIIKDKSRFFKFYIDGDGLGKFLELSITAQRVLVYLLTKKLEFGKDYVYVTGTVDCKKVEMSRASFSIGFNELIDQEWLFRSEESYKFWINVGFVSYGDREEMYSRTYNERKTRLKGNTNE